MIQTQIPPIDVTKIVWEILRRITYEILGVKGLIKKQEPMGSYYTSTNS